MLKPTIFREYDIRGIADSELLSPDVEHLGAAWVLTCDATAEARISTSDAIAA